MDDAPKGLSGSVWAPSTRTRPRKASLVAAVVAVVAGYSTVPLAAAAPKTTSGVTVSPIALGVNMAAWDSIYTGTGGTAVTTLLKGADLKLLRYPGGGWADEYDWSSNTDSSKCTGAVALGCLSHDPLGFDAFATHIETAGASSFVTVNYGSGTPAQAAAWVTHATKDKSDHVALWEVGNETYSCYEVNDHLAGSPTYVQGYVPAGSVCPTMAVMAESYSTNVLPYLAAMKKTGPAAKIGVPWAFSSNQAKGAGVNDASLWNAQVLHATGKDINFVDAHWFPFDLATGISAQDLLQSTTEIPAAAAQIRTTLRRDAPGATFVIGETNISERPTTLDFEPVAALFAAATSLTWLTQGAESVDWWDFNNFGSPTNGDYGMVSSGSPETEATGSPLPPYYGEQLASMLTGTGSHLKAFPTGSAEVLGFESDLAKVRHIMLVNTGSTEAAASTDSWFASRAQLHQVVYSRATSQAANPLTDSTVAAGGSDILPADSIVVLSGTPRK